MITKEINIKKTGTDGMHRVTLVDATYPVESRVIIADFTTKAIANSIARHGNREIRRAEHEARSQIDMGYIVEDRERLEPGLDHWR